MLPQEEIRSDVSLIKRHPLETVLILIIAGLSFLFYSYFNLDRDFRNYIIDQGKQTEKILTENTDMLRTNTEIIKQFSKP